MMFSHLNKAVEESMFRPTLSNDDLLGYILDAITECGGTANTLATPTEFPHQLEIRCSTNTYYTQIYFGELTKKSPSQSKFQFQVSGIDYFALAPGKKTIVLGLWKETNVFVGFDVRKHLGKLKPSNSFQILEDALRKAYVNDFYPYYMGNKETAIAFTTDFFIEYINNLELLHVFGESTHDLAILSDVTTVAEVDDAVTKIRDPERREIFVSLHKIFKKINFKKRVLNVYGYRCAFCGSFNSVEAAHIVPVNHEKSTDETRNGLALCALHRKAYDQALITIIEDYSIVLNQKRIDELKKISLDGGLSKFTKELRPIILLPPAINDRPHVEYIKIANAVRGWL